MQERRTRRTVSENQRYRRGWKRITVFLSLVVVVATISALMLPAITMNQQICQLAEHQHTELCYASGMVCTEVHQHGDTCYDADGNLTCGIADFVVHQHDTLCYDEAGILLCPLPQVEEHIHGDDCRTVADPGHIHDDGCYTWVQGTVCGMEESQEHTHTDECYTLERGELTCTQTEGTEAVSVLTCEKQEVIIHIHDETCYAPATEQSGAERELLCTQTQITAHQHEESCFAAGSPVLVCTLPEHSHDETCGFEEVFLEDAQWEALAPQVLSGTWTADLVDAARSQLGYRESVTDRRNDADGISHGATLYGTAAGDPYGNWQTAFVIWCLNHSGISGEFLPRHTDVADWQTLLKDASMLSTGEPGLGDVVFLDLDGDENADTVGVLTEILPEQPLMTWDGTEAQASLCTIQGDFEDSVAQVVYEPQMLTGFVSVADAQERRENWLAENPEVKGYQRTVQTEGVSITASWGADAGLPGNATFSAQTLEPETEEYEKYLDRLFGVLDVVELYNVQMLDLTFLDGEGQKIEPSASVDIQLRYEEPLLSIGTQYDVVHFLDDGGVELLSVTPMAEDEGLMGFQFSQNSFSVSALVISEPKASTPVKKSAVRAAVRAGEKGTSADIDMSDGEGSDTVRRKTDPVTMDVWENYFSPNTTNFHTEFAGGIVNDKSVTAGTVTYTNEDGVSGTIEADSGKFLVGLSSIGSTQTVSGLTSAPTDVIFILDMSSSMYGGHGTQTPEAIDAMLEALDNSINRLNELNEYNRIGVVLYRGYYYIDPQSDNTHSTVLLPLDRYTSTGKYIVSTLSSGKITGIKVNTGVKNSAGKTISKNYSFAQNGEYTAGTYTQAGILNAMDEFLAAETVVQSNSGEVPRRPVFVFMSDGEPTAATENYTGANKSTANGGKQYATMGNNQVASRHAAESDFVTQLTAAYAKEMVKRHYTECGEDPLYYTLGFKMEGLSLDIMDPTGCKTNPTIGLPRYRADEGSNEKVNLTEKIKGFWEKLLTDGSVTFTTKNYSSTNNTTVPPTQKNHTVKTTTIEGETFPSDISQQEYVDKYFPASDTKKLKDAFDSIILEISLHETFTVTESEMNHSTSGFVTFVDTVGEYMTVTDMEGILLNGELYTGKELAKNFLADGANGTPDPDNQLGSMLPDENGNYSTLGTYFLFSVMDQLGLPRDNQEQVQKGRNLIDAAYNVGQLYWNGENDFDHYIEWWAKVDPETGKHTFLGFHHEEGAPCEYDCKAEQHYVTAPEGATYLVRSYFYVGQTSGEDVGSQADSNMVYTMVWVRTELDTQQESVLFSLPNALIPTVDYDIGLDENKKVIRLESSGAATPAMLCYQVGLKSDVNVAELVEEGTYSGIQYDEAGNASEVYFYSNDFVLGAEDYYNLTNTFVYFEPGIDNSRYYYTGPVNQVQGSPTPIYTKTCKDDDCNNDKHYQQATAIEDPETHEYYERNIHYARDGDTLTEYVTYRRISASVFDEHEGDLYPHIEQINGYQYVKAGTPHAMTNETLLSTYAVAKDANNTGTALHADLPYTNPGEHTEGSRYIVGAMLGNNGRLAVTPVVLSGKKTMDGVDLSGYSFDFELYEADENFQTGKLIETVNNEGDAHDEIHFTPIWPAQPGSYYYVVREKVDDGNDYVIYDRSAYHIKIEVGNRQQTSVTVVKGGTDQNLSADALNFDNHVGTKLPNTGGAGTFLYIFSGWTMVSLACALVYSSKRKKRKEVR